MGLSLAFDIVFAAAGVALPLLLFITDALYLRTKEQPVGNPDPVADGTACRRRHRMQLEQPDLALASGSNGGS